MKFKANLVALFISLLMFVCLISYFNINYPIADDYNTYLDFLNDFTRANNFKDQLLILMNQYVDHRIVMARLVCLIYYKIFGQLNFRALLYISQCIMAISIYPFTWLLNKVNSKYKTANIILATCLILSPSLCGAYVWLSVTLQQDMQILFSLLSIMFLIKSEENKTLTNYAFYSLFMLLNVFSESGWIILFGAALLYCLLRKENLLLFLTLILFILIGIVFFKILPYEFLPHKFSSIYALILFILGFTGVTFFIGIPYVPFIMGLLLIIIILFHYKEIRNNNVYLIWFIFFFATALTVGVARIGVGSTGTDDRYAIYSLLNLGFIISLLSRSNNFLAGNKFWVTLTIMLMVCFIRALPDGGPYQSYQEGKFTINYPPDINRAIKTYHTSQQLSIYNNESMNAHIQHFYPLAKNPTIFNNSSGRGELFSSNLSNEYAILNGFVYLNGFDVSKYNKYLVWQSDKTKYWFFLDTKSSFIEQLLYKITNYYYFRFTNISYIKDFKPGKYNISLYLTNGQEGVFISLKTKCNNKVEIGSQDLCKH